MVSDALNTGYELLMRDGERTYGRRQHERWYRKHQIVFHVS